MKTFSKLCTPAKLYFVVSLLLLFMLMLTNMNNGNSLCIAGYSCSVTDKVLVFVLNLIYIVFYTYILNLICKDNWSSLAWFLVLLPFLLILLLLMFGMTAEPISEYEDPLLM
tara:strand:- start:245 stop:580 length:336 start_codon:yes stop_codon:yes gene_type:complete